MNQNVGIRIKKLRQQKGITQQELASLLGCSQSTIADWERSKNKAPSRKLIGEVAKIFGVSTDYLLGFKERETHQLPCYGEVDSENFLWSKEKIEYYVDVPENEYSKNRFVFRVLDNHLYPAVSQGDYCIFEKSPPENGDIVLARFPENSNQSTIKIWRQDNELAVLTEVNTENSLNPRFVKVKSKKDYTYKSYQGEKIVIEGKIVAVKKIIKIKKNSPKINYIF